MSEVSETMPDRQAGGWFSLTSSALTAVVVGFASTILLIIEAADAVGANAAQKASWAAALCIGQAIATVILSARYKMPIITAWSTPGAVLIATSAGGIGYQAALGAFIAAGVLTCITALLTPVARLIERIPPPIASAMLAGVLLRYSMGVPGAALELPLIVMTLVVVFFALRLWLPFFAGPVVVALGLVLAWATGTFGTDCCMLSVTEPVWTTPQFDWAAIIGLGVPLYLVTMASQNLPGFAVLKADGYQPPVAGSLWVTGIASILAAPFGSHQINLAAVTASIVTGPECHPDPRKRWLVAWPYLVLYIMVGLAAASFVAILGSLPKPLITAIAGLALFGPLLGSASAMFRDNGAIEAALITFLVSATGISIEGIGSPFWGLVAGLVLYGARRVQQMRNSV